MRRILHLSDPHFGAADPLIAECFIALSHRLRPALTILSGDLTMRATRQELAAARTFVDALPQPLLMIPGNHDIPAINQPFDRFFHPFRRFRRTFGENLEPEIRLPRLHVVSLNSTRAIGFHRDWSEGRLSLSQLAATETRFASGPPDSLRVLVLHHPLLEPVKPRRAVVKPLTRLLKTIERTRIDLVLCGHFHLSQVLTIGHSSHWHCIVSQAPTVCSTRLQGEAQGFHEILHDESSGEIEITHFLYENGDFHPRSTYGFTRHSNGWNTPTQ